MSSVTKQVLIIVKQQGLDQVNTSIKGLTSTTATATKSTTGLGSSWDKGQGSALKLRTGVTNLDKSESKAVKTTGTFVKETDKATKSTSGLAAKFQGNKGLIFSTIGIATAGLEAVGMLQQFQNASAKVAEAQDRLNQMQRAGITSGREYESAQRDVTDAQRGQQFALRILTLSMGDMIPFSLLLVNSLFKLRDTINSSKKATDAATQGITTLGNATKAASTGGIAQIANSASTATTGLTNMGNSSKLTNTAIGSLTTTATNFDKGLTTVNTRVLDATRLIGNNSSGLTGGYYGLSTGIDNSTKTSTKFKDAFAQIGTQIKALPNTLKGIGTSIASFFTNFGTHLGKLPGLFKTAGTAILGFGKALTIALLSNPITAIIAGISAAVLALATDFGGVRTAINNAGVAVGNAIPQLKGLLQSVGDLVNGGLDWIANQLGIKKSTDEVNKSSSDAAKQGLTELKNALVIPLQTSATFDKLRQGLGQLSQQAVYAGNAVSGANTWLTNLHNTLSKNQKTIPGVSAVLEEMNQIALESTEGGAKLDDIKQRLAASLLKLQLIITDTEMAEAKSIQTSEKGVGTSQKVQAATLGVSEGVLATWAAYQKLTFEQGKGTQASDQNAEAVAQLAMKYGVELPDDINLATDQQRIFMQSLYDLAPAFGLIEDHIDITNGKAINLGDVLVSMTERQVDLKAKALDLWGTMAAGITNVGENAFPVIEEAIKVLMELNPELGKIVEEMYTNYRDNTVTTAEGVMLVNEAEEEQKEKVKSVTEEISKKADELKILDKIQGLSIQNQQNAIKITEEQNKGIQETTLKLQQMAVARGMDIEAIGQENTALLNFIKTNNTSSITAKEVETVLQDLVATRLEDERASKVQNLAITTLLTSMGKAVPVIGMTNKGLETLLQTYDDTANASGIAADAIGTWVAGLEKEQAVEKATLSTLQDYAKQHDIVIPAAIANDIDKTKEYIEIVKGVGPAAKKATDEALKAFEELTGNTKSALEGIISDALGEDGDDVKKAIKGIKKVGLELTSITAKQHLINIFLNDENFENDIKSLGEVMIDEFGRMENFSAQEADHIVQTFIGGMIDHLGAEAPGVVDMALQIWEDIKNNPLPGESAQAQVGRFAQMLENIEPIATAAQKMGAAVPEGVQSGASGLEGIVQQVMNSGVQPMENAKDIYSKAAQALGLSVPEGVEQGAAPLSKILEPPINDLESLLTGSAPAFHQGGMTIGNEAIEGTATAIEGGASRVQNATLAGFNTPIMGAVGQIPTLAGTALAPLEGTAQGEFVKAQMAANSVISALLADINTSFGFLVQNVQQKLTEVSQAWITHSSNVQTISGQISTTIATITTSVTNFAGTAVKSLAGITATTTSTGNAFKTMGTSVSSGSSVGAAGVTNFTGIAGKGLGGIIAQAGSTGKAFSSMGSQISSAMSSASSAVSKFASSASSAFSKVGSQAAQATKMVKQLQSAINSLKSKSINIHVGLTGPGARFMRHGGAFISAEPTGFAQTGTSFVNTKPRKIGGVNISEFGKPELVTVTPLSDPGNPMDKNIGMSIPKPQAIPHHGGGLGGMVGGGNGSGGGQPITVTGDVHVSVMMPDGQVLAKSVRGYLLEGFSGIT